jgi:hypothetical protein
MRTGLLTVRILIFVVFEDTILENNKMAYKLTYIY